MRNPRQHPTAKGKSVSEDRESANAAPQVKVQKDGTVYVIYVSYDAYLRDQELLKAAKINHDQVAGASSEALKAQRRGRC